MNKVGRALRCLASAIFVSAICMGTVAAQPVGAGCVLDQAAFAGRQVLRCEGGLTFPWRAVLSIHSSIAIEMEKSTRPV